MSTRSEEIVARGKALYEQQIRQEVEPGNIGKILVINVETGEYEMDSDRLVASDRAVKRFPGALLYGHEDWLSHFGEAEGRCLMPTITLVTEIHAPIGLCFDLCRDLDIHARTVAHTRERLVGDTQGGMAEPGDVLTFEATHLGVQQRLTSQITEFERPTLFAEEALSGAFASLRHVHTFTEVPGGTLMRDTLTWTSPLGLLGRVADGLFLKRYMLRFLVIRNRNLKVICEAEAQGETAGSTG